MLTASTHRGHRHGLAPELGLHKVPTRSLVEFEGGGSMLTCKVLGEMLAANECGFWNTRRAAAMHGSNRAARKGESGTEGCARGRDGGPVEEGTRARLLCQSDALAWLRKTSAHANLRTPLYDGTPTTPRGGVKGPEQHRCHQQQSLSVTPRQTNHTGIVPGEIIEATNSTHGKVLPFGSPNKRRRHMPVKLYDHENNPRVLRTLVDDTVVTGIAGGGVLKAKEEQRMEDLRLQLRLACHQATKLEDQIFQSQTGSPHRKLLGELQLGREQNVLPLPPTADERMIIPAPMAADELPMIKVDLSKKGALTSGRTGYQQWWTSSTDKRRDMTVTATSSLRRRNAQHGVATACGAGTRNSFFVRKSKKRAYAGPAGTELSQVVATCRPPMSPPLTPTASLRRYLLSLRPFSADGARAAWGLANTTSGKVADPSELRRYVDVNTSEQRDPRWPVLFVMGSVKPPVRHPLDVYALPLFDDNMVALLAESSGEPANKIRAMTQVFSRFDFHGLQTSIEQLCCNTHAIGGRNRCSARRQSAGLERSGASGSVTQAWLTDNERTLTRKSGVSQETDWSNYGEKPVILSEAVAERALTSGFLQGVFGDEAVGDIVMASRPVVVFDSTENTEVSTGLIVEDLCARGQSVCARKDDGAIKKVRHDAAQNGPGNAQDGDHAAIPIRNDESQPNPPPTAVSPLGKAKTINPTHTNEGSVSRRGRFLLVDSARQGDTPMEQQASAKEEGVLVATLVRAAAARFRVQSVAVCHRDGGGAVNFLSMSSRGSVDKEFGRGLFIGGSGGGDWTVQGVQHGRPASAGSDELGLPPLKLLKREKDKQLRRAPWAASGEGACSALATRASERVGGDPEDGREDEEEMDTTGVNWPRSTPRCLRPGFKGEVSAAMLRRELEASEKTAARLGISMARKAEAWTIEAKEGQKDAAIATATEAANRASLALASTRACNALHAAAEERMHQAINTMYLGIVRRSWNSWMDLTRCRRSLEVAERVSLLVGAAALGFGVLEPLLRRKKCAWLHRWAGAMRAERVLEVQAAAVELQRAVQGFLGRARAKKRRYDIAAVAVQRVIRGRAGRARGLRRAKFLLEMEAVQTIERKYNEFVWQRDAVKLLALKKKERTATQIQAAWRGLVWGRRPVRLMRQARKKKASAIMVQRLWRGVVARAQADVLQEAKDRREAAVRIQAAARGRGARNTYCPIILRDRAANTLCRFWRCAKARRVARNKRWKLRLARLVNPLTRGFLGRAAARTAREERHQRQRATIVACVVAQKVFRGKRGRLKARRELLRRCAAVELQRRVRGRMVRRMSQVEKQKRQLAVTWMAAVGVQRVWRGLKGRRRLGQRRAEERQRAAAYTIQSAYRRYRHRRRRRLRRLARARGGTAAPVNEQNSSDDVAGDEDGSDKRREATAPTLGGGKDMDDDESNAAQRTDNRFGGRESSPPEGDSCQDASEQAGEPIIGDRTNKAEDKDGTGAIDEGEGAEEGKPASESLGSSSAGSKKAVADPAVGGMATDVSDTGGDTTEPEYEDVGDVAHAALAASRRSTGTSPEETLQWPAADKGPAGLSAFEATPIGPQPASEERLAYYEAKLRYLAAQEAAHGASAAKIQAMFRALVARRETRAIRTERDEIKRRQLEQIRAAVVLQAGARARAARLLVAGKRQAIWNAARQEQGSLIIQCAVRCFLAKCRLRHLRAAEQARRDRLHQMAARIQALARGTQTREVWRKFFKSRALLERERQRKGAQQIQSSWRSKLAKTEAERRKSARDAALLAEQLNRHLQSLLAPAMEAERKNAYAVRLQCWWRGILAVRAKSRRRLDLTEMPLGDLREGEEKAALAIQCYWRAYRARRFYNDNYASLFRERERKKYCTECQGEYATRTCDTCLDKFCEGCWARIHRKGARRFHNWEPFSVFSYGDFGHQGATPTTADSSGYYGYFPDWNGSAGDWTQEQQQAYGGNVNGYSGAGWEGGWAEVAGAKEGGAELWAVDPQHDPHSAYNQGSYSYSTEYEGYDYPGNEHGYQDWQQQEQQQQGWVQPWSADAYENGYYANQAPYASTGEAYGGAASYDGAACAPSEWSPDTAHNSNSSAADGGNQEKWAALSAATPQDWSGSTAETTDYYDYDGAAAFEAATNQAIVNVGKAAGDAADWEGWGTPGTASGTDGYASTSTSAGGGAGDTRGTDGRMSGEATSSSGRPWSVNEYGQRVCGDWVEYWDESAQAAYFYNTATGEASWTEPATG